MLGFLASCGGGAVVSERNPIVVENQQAGSSDWRLGQPGYSVADNATGQIKGYASATSVNKGEQIDFHVTVNPAQGYTIDVYRMGWYDGQGGRLLQNIGPLDGISQPECTVDPATGLADCDWSSSYTLAIPNTWTSGIYLAVLTNEQSYQNYIVFVVRDDTRTADLLYQQSVTTYQAYNTTQMTTVPARASTITTATARQSARPVASAQRKSPSTVLTATAMVRASSPTPGIPTGSGTLLAGLRSPATTSPTRQTSTPTLTERACWLTKVFCRLVTMSTGLKRCKTR
jgi:hypothetical protein